MVCGGNSREQEKHYGPPNAAGVRDAAGLGLVFIGP